jgi:hypothetical protein
MDLTAHNVPAGLRRFASPNKGFAQQRPGPAKCAGMRRGKERSD